jgi:hypothetical protein
MLQISYEIYSNKNVLKLYVVSANLKSYKFGHKTVNYEEKRKPPFLKVFYS